METDFPSSVIFDGYLPATQCCPGIWRWCINAFFSSTLLFLLLLSFIFSCFTWIENGNETGSPSGVLVASLYLCVTIISRLNLSPRIPLTKSLFLVLIEALIVFRDSPENMVLHANPFPRARETVAGFPFSVKGVL